MRSLYAGPLYKVAVARLAVHAVLRDACVAICCLHDNRSFFCARCEIIPDRTPQQFTSLELHFLGIELVINACVGIRRLHDSLSFCYSTIPEHTSQLHSLRFNHLILLIRIGVIQVNLKYPLSIYSHTYIVEQETNFLE